MPHLTSKQPSLALIYVPICPPPGEWSDASLPLGSPVAPARRALRVPLCHVSRVPCGDWHLRFTWQESFPSSDRGVEEVDVGVLSGCLFLSVFIHRQASATQQKDSRKNCWFFCHFPSHFAQAPSLDHGMPECS